ncbi:MAG: NfeD family protein [Muribaculum sp.]|nr:NfeD family protein [Muribaculum sp.]
MEFWIIWLIVAAVLLVIELITGFIASFCLAVGALLASVCGIFGLGIEMQLIALVVGVVLSFIFLAPLVNRLRGRRKTHREDYNSNMNALIGREGFVEKAIAADGSLGRMRVDGDSWQIRSADGGSISHGAKVKVVGYDSIILIVKTV